MKAITNQLIGILILSTVLISCGQNSTEQTSHTEIQKIFEIKGENIVLREGPGEKFKKIINEKATKLLGETQYANIDYSVKVEIEEEKENWSKIKVIEPPHLSSTHIGWIPSEYIKRNETKSSENEKLDASTYKIIKTKHNLTVENYYVLIKFTDFDKDKIRDFVSKFRNEHTQKDANIHIYDSELIIQLVDKYPLGKSEYLKVADHFVATSTFDSPNTVWWYPFQDSKYKEYGGSNWKKEPIK